jgi:ubiquinone/menaquinone biosynthesis C-methylase UbiE
MQNMEEHFAGIADHYNDLRTTDNDPIQYIRDLLLERNHCVAIDVGCGPGRYDLLLLQMLPQLHLICLDQNRNMIIETTRLLHEAGFDRFDTATANADEFPIDSNSIDVVFTFNAIHHFILPGFLREARRVLKKDGILIIYTRLPVQNENSVWGKYFPDFKTVERRLYSFDDINTVIRSVPGLALDTVRLFRFERVNSLERLVKQARVGHYSTFKLYNKKRLEECIAEFRDNVLREFSNPDEIRWTDENILLTVKVCQPWPKYDGHDLSGARSA